MAGRAAPSVVFPWGDQVPTLAGGRVVLRPVDEADAAGLLAIFGDGEVVRYWSRPALPDLEAAAQLLDEIQEDFFRRRSFYWGITDGTSGALIGTCVLGALSVRHRRAEVGFGLRRDHWGQGLATEALAVLFGFCFDRLGLHRLEADVDPDNLRSLRLLERLGFQREGQLRQRWHTYHQPGTLGGFPDPPAATPLGTAQLHPRDQARDAVVLGLLRPDWRTP